jgi:dihydropyrimidinase
VTGWPAVTILRGTVAAEDGKVLVDKGAGQFLRRDLSPFASPRRAAA